MALVSVKGAPGVTVSTAALALTWPDPVLLAECDPAGGDLLAGFLHGEVAADRGLPTLAAAVHRDGMQADLSPHLLPLSQDSEMLLLPGVTDPRQAAAAARSWPRVAQLLRHVSSENGAGRWDVVADCGRLGAAHAPAALTQRADLVVLVLRSSLPAIRAARAWIVAVQAQRSSPRGVGVAAVLVGERAPYGRKEVEAHLEVPVAGVLPWDPGAAAVLSRGVSASRRFTRSPLLRAAQVTGEQLRRIVALNETRVAAPVGSAVKESSDA